MNRDAEAINDLLAWLFQDPDPADDVSSGADSSTFADHQSSDAQGLNPDNLKRSVAEERRTMPSPLSSNHSERSSDDRLPEQSSLFNVGEISAVQDRFHALLKRRLRTEIARKPPVFPWESEAYGYDSEFQDLAPATSAQTKAWAEQIQNRIPVPMSEQILTELLQRCQTLAQSSLQRGVQLVQAVESLFPGEGQTLNHLAGLVLTSPARSATLSSPTAAQSLPGFPSHYDAATPVQQMALSLLAAQEIIESLTLKLSSDQPTTSCQWSTSLGNLSVKAGFDARLQRLNVEALLPCAGKLQLQGSGIETMAQRTSSGTLNVELFEAEVDSIYSLDIELEQGDRSSLTFAIHVASKL
ncbi:MAG: hypothetical protein WBA57_15275 [Elainellaceae cyanobacterium]